MSFREQKFRCVSCNEEEMITLQVLTRPIQSMYIICTHCGGEMVPVLTIKFPPEESVQ